MTPCPRCDGTGVIDNHNEVRDPQQQEDHPCRYCAGDGFIDETEAAA